MPAIGVTGHRFLASLEGISTSVEMALDRIEQAFLDGTLKVISPLAEGADRLVAQRVLRRPGAHLMVPLPMPQSDYMTDFESDASRLEFLELLARADEVVRLPLVQDRDQAYAAAGWYVLDHSEVLIGIWDGKPAQGTAGTSEIVAQARARRLPLAWIHAGNRLSGTDAPTSLGMRHGKVTFENFPQPGRKT